LSAIFGRGDTIPTSDGGLKSPLARKSNDGDPASASTFEPEAPPAVGKRLPTRRVSEAKNLSSQARKEGVTSAAKSAAKTKARKTAVKAASTAGVVGADKVSKAPLSARAWGESLGRTSVAWALKPLGGKRSEQLIHRFGYQRLALGLVVSIILSIFLIAGVTAAVVVTVTDAVTKPAAVAQSVVDKLLGRDNDGAESGFTSEERLCAPVPAPQPAELPMESLPTPSTSPAPTRGSRAPSTSPTPTPETFTPKPPLDQEGMLTEASKRFMRQVPRNADPVRAETWLLYVMSHPTDDPRSEWDRFGVVFDSARNASASGGNVSPESRNPSSTGDDLRSSDPLALVMAIDRRPDYLPFVLPAASIITALHLDEKLILLPEQEESVITRMMNACKPIPAS